MAQAAAPLPGMIEPLLWMGLVAWLLFVGLSAQRVGSANLAMWLCLASFPIVSGVFVIPEALPKTSSGPEIRLILWLAAAVGMTGVLMWLRHRSDGDDGGGDDETSPEPPWWPEFERDFHRYAQRRRPREPVV